MPKEATCGIYYVWSIVYTLGSTYTNGWGIAWEVRSGSDQGSRRLTANWLISGALIFPGAHLGSLLLLLMVQLRINQSINQSVSQSVSACKVRYTLGPTIPKGLAFSLCHYILVEHASSILSTTYYYTYISRWSLREEPIAIRQTWQINIGERDSDAFSLNSRLHYLCTVDFNKTRQKSSPNHIIDLLSCMRSQLYNIITTLHINKIYYTFCLHYSARYCTPTVLL